jgi:DNA polymerase-1
MTTRFVFDIESDGLLPTVSAVWCLVIKDADTQETFSYSDYDSELPDLATGLAKLYEADELIGHNIIGYDLAVLKKLFGWTPLPNQRLIDTWILSQVNSFKRKFTRYHSLKDWGVHLGDNKIEWNDWSGYSKDMLRYCIQDTALNVKVYKLLAAEAKAIIQKNPLYRKGVEVEMEFAVIESEIQAKGWMFDMAAAQTLLTEINNKLDAIEAVLEPRIGMRCIKLDGKDEYKEPAWRKDGFYTVNTVKHFNLPQESGRTTRPIEGPYCRVSFEQGKVGSIEVVKDWLYSIGWVPDEWNVEKVNGKFVNKSPKITESSLEKLGPDAMLVSEFYTIRSRKGILEGWIEAVKNSPDNRLHGRMWTVGTATFRCRHEVVANIPSVDSVYGKEMRALLICEPGTVIVGADSAGNQMRGLCHYIGNKDFTDTVINGDIHQKNADILSGVYPTPRKSAKPWLYAYLFGAGPGKLGNILTGKTDVKIGKQSADLFESSIPGLAALKDSLNSMYERTENAFGKGNAFIRGLDGRLVFVNSQHQVLNYTLQTTEGITCKAAAVWLKKELNKLGIQYYFTLHMHDEVAVVCKEQDADIVKELSIRAFTEAPQAFNVMCMGGDAHVGGDYSKVH